LSGAGVVAALGAEARTLGRPVRRSDGLFAVDDGILMAVSGMGCPAAAAAARRLLDAGATALVSWGMAGGLDPKLTAGTICLPRSVVTEDGGTFSTDHHWREILAAAVAAHNSIEGGDLLTSPISIDDVAGKAAAYLRTGAVAVDMESSGVAAIAAAHRVPFIAIRVIVDTAADELPGAAVEAIQSGRVRISRLIVGIVRRPRDIAPLMRLAGRYRAAKRALTEVARTGVLAPMALALSASNRIA
jgi:hopanoid-associated phosphorylase